MNKKFGLGIMTIFFMFLVCNIVYASTLSEIYFNDFSSGAGSEWSNQSTATSNGEFFLGSSKYGFGNGSITLSLNNIPIHDFVTIDFDLYIIRSWDGNGPHGGGADNWKLTAEGNLLIYTNFANYTDGNTQTYPNQLPPLGSGGSFLPRTGAFENGHLGFGTDAWGDATYRFSLTFPHTTSSLQLDFTSLQNQNPNDEGWGLDNVRVTISSPVPLPSAIFLLASGLAGLVGWNCRKKRYNSV